jgi:hypothetical protein
MESTPSLSDILLKKVRIPLYDSYYDSDVMYDANLVEGLASALQFYQESCKSTPLHDIICQTTTHYVPTPLTPDELMTNGNVVNYLDKTSTTGVYGEVYFNRYKSHSIAIKLPKRPLYNLVKDPNLYLREVFVNFVILNHYIELGNTHLVPTYGFFLCDKPDEKIGRPICTKKTGFPWIHMIQQKIEGTTLKNKIEHMTLPECKKVLYQVLNTLILLQESEYHIVHNDLNLDNIMVSEDLHAWIIDWGHVSFTYKGKRYKGAVESMYESTEGIMGGTNDLFFLLDSIYQFSKDSELKKWAQTDHFNLFHKKFKNKDLEWISVYDKPTLYYFLLQEESKNPLAHEYNLRYINSLNYRKLSELLGMHSEKLGRRPKRVCKSKKNKKFLKTFKIKKNSCQR